MKKILVLFLILLLFSVQAHAAGIYTTVAKGSVTQANMKISAVDGTAFVDFGDQILYQSDFSAGVGGWHVSTGTTISGNIDGIGGENDCLRVTCTNINDIHMIYESFENLNRRGLLTKISFKIYIPSTNSHVNGVSFRGAPYYKESTNLIPILDTWTEYVVYVTPIAANGSYALHLTNNGNIVFQDPDADDVIYIKDYKVSSVDLNKFLGHLLKIRDSSGMAIQGFIKAAGSGETEGAELNSGTCAAGKLYKITATEANHFGTGKVVGNYFTSAGTETLDANNKVKEISTPSATGVTIVSGKGGTTYNFALKNSTFNYNDASGYTYEIIQVRQLPAIAGGAVTAGNEHLSLVDGNAFYFGSIDMTNYQDGKHLLRLQDSTGYVAFARIKAEAPAGVALGSEFITSVTNSPLPFETLTMNANGKDIDQAVNTTSSGMAYTNTTLTLNALYKIDANLTINSGTAPRLLTGRGSSGDSTNRVLATLSAGAQTLYTTATAAGGNADTSLIVNIQSGSVSDFALVWSAKPMTIPPATGALLENSAGTRNMIYTHPSFKPNAIANIQILYVGD